MCPEKETKCQDGKSRFFVCDTLRVDCERWKTCNVYRTETLYVVVIYLCGRAREAHGVVATLETSIKATMKLRCYAALKREVNVNITETKTSVDQKPISPDVKADIIQQDTS